MPNTSELILNDVTVQFGGLKAVADVSFSVPKGQIVGLIGPNGAGKTTIFNVITGVYIPADGEVAFSGKVIAKRPPRKSVAQRILCILGFWLLILRAISHSLRGIKLSYRPKDITELGIARTFQNIRLFTAMTALENVMVARHCRSTKGVVGAVLRSPSQRKEEQDIREAAQKALDFMGIGDMAHEVASNLPYGHQRRLEIARALATDPKVILLDEPAAGMNPAESADLMHYILKIRDHGISVLMVEHDMKVVMGICDRIVVLDHGVKISEGNPTEVQRDPKVIEAYLGQ